MLYRVELGSAADGQLGELDSAIGASVERKILWLAENAAVVVHRRLVGMPDDLAGLCKLRVGDWRIICDIHDHRIVVRVLRVGNRREIYR